MPTLRVARRVLSRGARCSRSRDEWWGLLVPVTLVKDYDAAVPSHLAEECKGHVLALADGAEQVLVLGPDEQGVVLLVLGAPQLHGAHGLVTDGQAPEVYLGPDRLACVD